MHHAVATQWFGGVRRDGWATCPVTELGFIRVSSNASCIDGAVKPPEAAELLRRATRDTAHRFWSDDLRPCSERVLDTANQGHRQVTVAYLIALANHHSGVLATLDTAHQSNASVEVIRST